MEHPDTARLIIFNGKLLPPPTYTVQKQKGSDLMYYGTKGWYVAELKIRCALSRRTKTRKLPRTYLTQFTNRTTRKIKRTVIY